MIASVARDQDRNHRRDRPPADRPFVAAFLAPAQIKETQLPYRASPRGSNSKRFFESDRRPPESGIFRCAVFFISVGGFPEDLLPQL
jgi:hypothetical protein